MLVKFKRLGALTGLILGAFAMQGAAMASCFQSDAGGIWQAYSISASSGGANWVRCKITINSVGTIATNTCTSASGATASMTNGKVLLSNATNCTFTGSFNLGGAFNVIRHSTLSRDKISVEGVGTFPGGIFSFSLTKI